jgi:hypothetical protein
MIALYQWNQSYIDESLEAPLDHFQSTLWKPFYHLVGCPDMNATIASNGSVRDIMDTIPMIMISARPYHLVAPVLQTWTDANFNLQLFNTTALSRAAYHNDTRCHGRRVFNHQGGGGSSLLSLSFKSRLFGIYQRVLEQYVNTYDYIVTVEDDVRLVNGDGLRHELRLAIERYHFEYYSFTKNHPAAADNEDNHQHCLYRFGTTAQLWSQKMMRKVIYDVDDDTYCRLPIDMYIAQQGPWYVTQRQLVQHVGTRMTNVGS